MHARVTSLSGSPGEVDAGIADFREKVVPFTHEQGAAVAEEMRTSEEPTVDRYEVAVFET